MMGGGVQTHTFADDPLFAVYGYYFYFKDKG
jgi:hypothetical protein